MCKKQRVKKNGLGAQRESAGSGHIADYRRVVKKTVGAMPTKSLFAHRTAGGNGANEQRRSRRGFRA